MEVSPCTARCKGPGPWDLEGEGELRGGGVLAPCLGQPESMGRPANSSPGAHFHPARHLDRAPRLLGDVETSLPSC